jgi:hypothetical protein
MRAGRREWLIIALVVLLVFAVTTAIIKITSGPSAVAGRPSAVGQDTVLTPGGTELINPDSELGYRLPAAGWRPEPTIGPVGTITLDQGALRTPYQCGGSVYARGQLGSGRAAVTDPGVLAASMASAAASQFYSETTPTGTSTPTVHRGTTSAIQRRLPNGQLVSGAIATAIATQSADRCLASRGEIVVLVLRLPDRDAVLVVNGDLAGGPPDPAPATDAELKGIIDSTTLVS